MTTKSRFALAVAITLLVSILTITILVLRPREIKIGKAALPGDVNGDGIVNILDFQLLSNSFGKSVGQTGYDARCNFNADNSVNVLDFQILSNNFGKTETVTNTPTPKVTQGPTPTFPPPPTGGGIWISKSELMALPSSGTAWNGLKSSCDSLTASPGLLAQAGGHTSEHDVKTLACAYVAVRLNSPSYYQKTVDNLVAAVGSETRCGGDTCNSLSLHRNLAAYAIAADVIDFPHNGYSAYGKTEAYFRDWLNRMLVYDHPAGGGCGGSNCDVISKHENHASNHGTVAGASRMAIDLYLGNTADFTKAAKVFKGYTGDRSSWVFNTAFGDTSWQCNPSLPIPINPQGCTKVYSGTTYSIDGAEAAEMQRGGAFQLPPIRTQYPWAALTGSVVQAEILYRKGYDSYGWGNQAMKRAVQFLYNLDKTYGGWWATHSQQAWIPWTINKRYGTGFPTISPMNEGTNMGWTDWTHK